MLRWQASVCIFVGSKNATSSSSVESRRIHPSARPLNGGDSVILMRIDVDERKDGYLVTSDSLLVVAVELCSLLRGQPCYPG